VSCCITSEVRGLLGAKVHITVGTNIKNQADAVNTAPASEPTYVTLLQFTPTHLCCNTAGNVRSSSHCHSLLVLQPVHPVNLSWLPQVLWGWGRQVLQDKNTASDKTHASAQNILLHRTQGPRRQHQRNRTCTQAASDQDQCIQGQRPASAHVMVCVQQAQTSRTGKCSAQHSPKER
jgi:hypothetical protein